MCVLPSSEKYCIVTRWLILFIFTSNHIPWLGVSYHSCLTRWGYPAPRDTSHTYTFINAFDIKSTSRTQINQIHKNVYEHRSKLSRSPVHFRYNPTNNYHRFPSLARKVSLWSLSSRMYCVQIIKLSRIIKTKCVCSWSQQIKYAVIRKIE